jgi:hypothetical protein
MRAGRGLPEAELVLPVPCSSVSASPSNCPEAVAGPPETDVGGFVPNCGIIGQSLECFFFFC